MLLLSNLNLAHDKVCKNEVHGLEKVETSAVTAPSKEFPGKGVKVDRWTGNYLTLNLQVMCKQVSFL